MNSPTLKRPSPGTVLGLLALIVAVAGNTGAFAGSGSKVTKHDLAKGAVTARALAPGAVRAKALANGAVAAKAIKQGAVGAGALGADAVGPASIKPGAVGARALAPNAVTASALAPGSVYGGALGPVELRSMALVDHDEAADLSTWTTSDTATVSCSPGQRLLSGGVILTNPGNRRVAIVRALPISNPLGDSFSGQITTDSGGTATAEVQAICLK
jgi:hypothetical protein